MSWDPLFVRKSPLFWPIARAAAALEGFGEWPTPDELTNAFDPRPPVRFALAAARPRRGRAPAGPRYDARITLEGVVPTRARSWHDLMSALVWVSFPQAKLALHQRQHAMIEARAGADQRLPGARSPEQDAVAMLDEGGVVLLRAGEESRAVVFGHAIYEGFVCGAPPNVRGAGFAVTLDALPSSDRLLVAAADAGLAALLGRSSPVSRSELETVVIDERLAPPARAPSPHALTP